MSAAAGLLVGIWLLPTPERGRMARQNAPDMVRMGSPDGCTGFWLRGGVNPCHAHLSVTKISARARRNRTRAVAGRGPGPERREVGARIHPHQGRAERMTREPAPEKPAAPLQQPSSSMSAVTEHLLLRVQGRVDARMAGRMAVLRGGDLNGPATPRQRWSVPQHNTQ